MVLWTGAAGVLAFRLWRLMEKIDAKLDMIAGDLRSLSQKAELLVLELQRISMSARDQVETVGTIVRDVRGWVDKAETTVNVVSALMQHGVHSGLANARAFLTGMMSFLRFFTHAEAPHRGAPASDVSNGKED
jgi:hypothetical protein